MMNGENIDIEYQAIADYWLNEGSEPSVVGTISVMKNKKLKANYYRRLAAMLEEKA